MLAKGRLADPFEVSDATACGTNCDPDVKKSSQAQIDATAKKWGFYFMEGKAPHYDPRLPTEGLTTPEGYVTIGPKNLFQ